MSKYISDFVREQQNLNLGIRARRVRYIPSTGGATYDPFKKLEKAWAAWANRDRTATDKLLAEKGRRVRRRQNRQERLNATR